MDGLAPLNDLGREGRVEEDEGVVRRHPHPFLLHLTFEGLRCYARFEGL